MRLACSRRSDSGGATRKDARSARRGPLPNPHAYYSLASLPHYPNAWNGLEIFWKALIHELKYSRKGSLKKDPIRAEPHSREIKGRLFQYRGWSTLTVWNNRGLDLWTRFQLTRVTNCKLLWWNNFPYLHYMPLYHWWCHIFLNNNNNNI